MKTNSIGLDKKKADLLAASLNELLANYHVFYQNLRGFHWNIKGKLFFELHVKFEEYYNDAILKIDELAERILTLDASPLHSYNAFLKFSEIKPAENFTDGKAMVQIVLENLQLLIRKERNILDLAGTAGDEGTASIISDYIQQQEKTVWMLKAYSE
jgi:starvation-inducible DNA-binding protein